ncbi:MAG: PEGA domain-containing protein [Patescibacteria group bacterium]
MNLRQRRIYYSSFIVLFLALAPVVLLYSLGYRYDWQMHSLYKIGSIKIDSQPDQADIYLNGQLVGESKHLITNLRPDFYTVEVKKEGYFPWQKQIEVLPAQTAIFEDIVLYRNDQDPENIIEDILSYSVSHDKNNIIYQDTDNQLWHQKLTGDKRKITLPSKDTISNYYWSYQGNQVVITQSSGQHYLVDANHIDQISNLNPLINFQINDLRWDQLSDDYFYFSNNQKLYRFNVPTNKLEIISGTGDALLDYQGRDNLIYLLNNTELGVKLRAYSPDSKDGQEISHWPDSSAMYFQPMVNSTDYLVIYDLDNQDTIIFSINDNQVLATINASLKIDMATDANHLLFLDDHELWTWDQQSLQSNLVTRYSSLITDAIIYNGYPYALFVTKNRIKAIEFDQRTSITQDLAESDALDLFLHNKKDLYFFEKQPTKVTTYILKKLIIN